MTGLQEMVLIGEIALQSQIAQRANERLQANHNTLDKIEVWCSIQSILVAVGNVSKILWPVSKMYKPRGERLRQILKVDNNNPLSDRSFRNHFEHYDERIEKELNDHPSAVYSDLAMNPSLRGNVGHKSHRGYNSFNNTLVFRDETLDLNKILKALEEILNNCRSYVLV